jgi:hypothetical protein
MVSRWHKTMDVTVSNVEYKTDTLLVPCMPRNETMYQNLDEAIHMGKVIVLLTWSSVLALHAPVTNTRHQYYARSSDWRYHHEC